MLQQGLGSSGPDDLSSIITDSLRFFFLKLGLERKNKVDAEELGRHPWIQVIMFKNLLFP